MKINNVKPFVLGIGSLVAASASASLNEMDDELLVAQPLLDDVIVLTGSDEGEGEGECGEGQCGEDGDSGEGECGEDGDDGEGDDEEGDDEEGDDEETEEETEE